MVQSCLLDFLLWLDFQACQESLCKIFYVGTGGERIYGGKFESQLAHSFSKHLHFEKSDLYCQNCIEHFLFLIRDENF